MQSNPRPKLHRAERFGVQASKHVLQIGTYGRIAEDRMFQSAGRNSRLHRQCEDVDQFICVRADQMGAQKTITTVFNQDFKARAVLTYPT